MCENKVWKVKEEKVHLKSCLQYWCLRQTNGNNYMTQFTYFITCSDDDCHLIFMNWKCFLGYNCFISCKRKQKSSGLILLVL